MREAFDRAAALAAVDRDAAAPRPEFQRELWDVVESSCRDADDGLAVVGPAGRNPVSSPWLVAAAVVAVVAVAASVVWLTNSSDSIVLTDSTVPTVPETRPSRTPPATTVAPASTSTPSSTVLSPMTSAPSTVAPPPIVEPIAVSYLDPPPVYEPEVLAELETEMTTVALGDDFVVGGFMGDVTTSADDQLVVLDLDGNGTNRIDVDQLPRGLIAGPGRVVYGETSVTAPDTSVLEQRFVAIALSGERAGQTILDVPSRGHPLDPLSDDFYDHDAVGVVDVANGGTQVTPFLDPTGQPIDPAGPWPSVLYDFDMDSVVSRDGPTWTLSVARHPDAPSVLVEHVGAGAGGSGVYTTWIGPRVGDDLDYSPATIQVIAALLPDGAGTWYRLPDGWNVGDSNQWGTLLVRVAGGRTQLAWFEPTTTGATDPVLADVPAG